jgi:hypothetical protein
MMAKLTTNARKSLSKKSFAEPGKRKYPIEDASHARNALARVSQHGTASEKAQVRAAVHKKFPAIKMKTVEGVWDAEADSPGQPDLMDFYQVMSMTEHG